MESVGEIQDSVAECVLEISEHGLDVEAQHSQVDSHVDEFVVSDLVVEGNVEIVTESDRSVFVVVPPAVAQVAEDEEEEEDDDEEEDEEEDEDEEEESPDGSDSNDDFGAGLLS